MFFRYKHKKIKEIVANTLYFVIKSGEMKSAAVASWGFRAVNPVNYCMGGTSYFSITEFNRQDI